MSLLPLQTGAENPVLRKVCEPVSKTDSKTKKLMKDMKDTIVKHQGLGLAAPQVGENVRIILARFNAKTENENLMAMINPEITYCSEEKESAEEGCLSLPNQYGTVVRSREITVVFSTEKGAAMTLRLEGLNARIVQHEVDHLNGILFIDYPETIMTSA